MNKRLTKPEISIKPVSFPNQNASDAEKASPEFGLSVGKAIMGEWFYNDSSNQSNSHFYDQYAIFHERRLYAQGKQSVAKYKKEFQTQGDLSYINLDWTPIPIIPKFVDIVVNGMQDRLLSVKANAQDPLSQEKKSEYQEMIEGQMVARELLEVIQESTGADPFTMPPDELPENEEQSALHMQLNYKPAIEIAEELAISSIMEENRYFDLKKRLDRDQVEIGIAIAKHEFREGDGVRLAYVDPANVVYSYTEDPYFRDCFYWGEIEIAHLSEVYKYNQDIPEDLMEEIKQYSTMWYEYHHLGHFFQRSMFTQDSCVLFHFNYKTTKKVVHKKKFTKTGGRKAIKKDDSFNPPAEVMAEERFEKIEKTIDVWYEGVMIAGTNIILKWELMENMVRPKSSSQHAIPCYVACAPRAYKGRIESLVSRMMSFADLIQMTHLKLQQVIQRIVPDGVFVDADGINEVDLGTGQAYNPKEALNLYFQTGSVIGRSLTNEGEFNHGRIPIQELTKSGANEKINTLITSYNHYLNSIRDVTGLNEARDGSMPDPKSLVGLQKLAALNSNTATRHVLDAGMYITKSLAEAITYRVSDILEYADFKEDFANRIGKYNAALLEEIKELYIYDFGIYLEVTPDEEEKAQLEANIQQALQQQDINLEDAIDIREIKNIKLANQLLKLKRKKKEEADRQFEREKQAMQSETQRQAQEMARQVAAEKIALEKDSKISQANAETEGKIKELDKEAELKSKLMREEFEYKMQILEKQQEYLNQRDDYKEQQKNQREDKRSTAQSQLINQRKNNLPPQNFESRQDTMDGFNLQEFNLRP